jgi:extradiol dioxygenase family protein
MSVLHPFHLAFPVHDLDAARTFYRDVMGCAEGRSSDQWIDFNLFGHQIVAHLTPASARPPHANHVDGQDVPVPHFGVVLPMAQWQELAGRLKDSGIRFELEPQIRFKGEVGEQATMFFFDPSRNALEFKAFADIERLFAK